MSALIAVCLPPDATRFGRWWVRNGRERQVWEWAPDCGCWWAFQNSVQPDWAAERGWQVIGPAVPPCEEVDGSADARLEGERRPVEARHDAAENAVSGAVPALRWERHGYMHVGYSGTETVAVVERTPGTAFKPGVTPVWEWTVFACAEDDRARGETDTPAAAKAAADAAFAAWCDRAGLVARGAP